jgi:hypothetical protein
MEETLKNGMIVDLGLLLHINYQELNLKYPQFHINY